MQELERQLKDEDTEIRRIAVESLKGRGRAAVPLLINAMKDVSWRVRHYATDILIEEHPVEEYISNLIDLLYIEDNAGARNSAIEALVRLGKKVTPYLLEAFNTPNKDVRKFIIDVLGEFKDERSLPLMLNALKDDDENVRVTAIEHIGKAGESSVVDALIDIIEGDDLWTAYPAVDALGRIGDRRAIPALKKAMKKKPLRAISIKSLGRIGDPEGLTSVIECLQDNIKSVQEEAIRSLERFYRKGVSEEYIVNEIKKTLGEKIFDILIPYTRSPKPEIKISSILILGILKDERAFAPLLEISQEEEFSEDVKRAFVFIGRDKPESLLSLFNTENIFQKRFICEVAGRIASPVFFNIFKELLHDEDGHIRSLSAIALANIGNPGAIIHLKKLLTDPYEDIQEAAVKALSAFGRLLDVNEFIEMLKNPSPLLRKNAALILGRIGATEAVNALGFALKDGDVNVRGACVQAFSMLRTEDSIKYLIIALSDEKPYIRVSASLSLAQTGGENIFEALSFLVKDIDDSVRVAIAKAFGILNDRRAIGLLKDMLNDKNGFVVTTTIESLGKYKDKESKDALLMMLKHNDKEIRRTAIRALSGFEGIEFDIIPFLHDEDWATRMAAVSVLGTKPDGIIRKELERLYDSEEDPIVKKAIEESLAKKSDFYS